MLQNVKVSKLPTRALFVTGTHGNVTFHFTSEAKVVKFEKRSRLVVTYTRRRGSLLLGVTNAH